MGWLLPESMNLPDFSIVWKCIIKIQNPFYFQQGSIQFQSYGFSNLFRLSCVIIEHALGVKEAIWGKILSLPDTSFSHHEDGFNECLFEDDHRHRATLIKCTPNNNLALREQNNSQWKTKLQASPSRFNNELP